MSTDRAGLPAADLLDVAQGRFRLARPSVRAGETLRAWDAADEYVLRHIAAQSRPLGSTVLVNDSCGALAVTLSAVEPVSLGDSVTAHDATLANLATNELGPTYVRCMGSLEPLPPTHDRIDTLVVKIPKSLALLEDQLRRLAPHVHEATLVVGAAMTKHVHTSTIELFESILGPTSTTLAEKKARLLLCSPHADGANDAGERTWPRRYVVTEHESGERCTVVSHAGVFGAERLDRGTALLLDHLEHPGAPEVVVDLGCGTGVLGTIAAMANPHAEVVFVDDSYLAVASAEATLRANLGDERSARFVAASSLSDDAAALESGSVDRVLCNPPFHIDVAIGDATAWQMFSDSKRVLRPGGELWVVGNRHLAYHAKLHRLFGNCEVMGSDSKFVVLRARSVRRSSIR